MAAQREPLRAVVADDLLPFAGRRQHGASSPGWRAQQVLVRHRAHRLPQGLAPVAGQRLAAHSRRPAPAGRRGPGSRGAPGRPRRRRDGSRAPLRCARRRPCSSRAAGAGRGAPPAGDGKKRRRPACMRIPFFQRRLPAADRHIHRAHLDAMAARILHQLRGAVEAHRLAVQQRAQEMPPARGT
jgi:hypothetical protein